jgi:transposase-like protein
MKKSDIQKQQIQLELDNIISSDIDISNHLATKDDLPDLGMIDLYDYDSDLTVAAQQAQGVLESLVNLYLGDIPNLKDHPYIKNKVKEDSFVYAETVFLSKMTRKNFLTQLRQVDAGENSARLHEIINQTIREVRENAKFSSIQKTELEKYYKELRKDLIDVIDIVKQTDGTPTNANETIMDNSKLNDLINSALKNKK